MKSDRAKRARAITSSLLAFCLLTSAPSSSAVEAALTPVISSTISLRDGFAFSIANFNVLYSWSVTTTAGTALLQNGIVTVSGLYPGQVALVTVTSKRTGYRDGSSTVTGTTTTPTVPTATPQPSATPTSGIQYSPTPRFSSITSTADGFTALIINFDPSFTWSASTTYGSVSLKGAAITVTQLAPGQSSLITITASRAGYVSSSNTLSGSPRPAITASPQPTQPIPTNSSTTSATPSNSASSSQSSSPNSSSTPTSTIKPTPSQSAKPSSSPSATPISTNQAPLQKNATVLVPVLSKAKFSNSTGKPNSTFRFLILGGVADKKIKDLPYVKFAALQKRIEIQLTPGITTSTTIAGFKSNSLAQIQISNDAGKILKLTPLKTSKTGTLQLTPITFTSAKKFLKIKITISGKSKTITIRS